MSKPDDSLFDDLPEPNSRNNQVPGDDENPFAEAPSDDLSDLVDDLPFDDFVSLEEDDNDASENTIPSSEVFPNLNLDSDDDISGDDFADPFKDDAESEEKDDFTALLADDFTAPEVSAPSVDAQEAVEDVVIPEISEIEEQEVDILSEPVSEDFSFPELDLGMNSEHNSGLGSLPDWDPDADLEEEEDVVIELPEIEESQETSVVSEPVVEVGEVAEDFAFSDLNLGSDSNMDSGLDLDMPPDSDVIESVPLEAGMAEVSIVADDPTDRKGKKKKKEKKVKAVKEKKPKVPRESREGEMNKIALTIAAIFLALFALINVYAVFSYGLSALFFLIFFDLFAVGVIAVPVLLGRTKEKLTTYDIALAISLVAILLSCMLLLTRLAEYGGKVNTKNFSSNIHVTDDSLDLYA